MRSESWRPTPAGAGILLFSLGILLFALNDALGKLLMADATSQQVLLVRSIGAFAVLTPLVLRHPGRIRLRGQVGLHVLRVACMSADSFAFYLSTKYLPLAEVMTFYLAAPLMITALSAAFLGERVGWFRWTAVLVGFVGVVIALKPGGDAAISIGALIALSGACMFAGAITTTRKLRDTHWVGLIFWQFVGSGLVGAATSPFGWHTPSLRAVALMAVVGLLALMAFICITKALTLAKASAVAPFTYGSIVWASLLGWAIWGDVPGLHTTTGIVIIVASGLVVWWRERGREAVSPPAAPFP